jgi:pectinesterase
MRADGRVFEKLETSMKTAKRSTKSHEISRNKAFISCGFVCFRGSYLFLSSLPGLTLQALCWRHASRALDPKVWLASIVLLVLSQVAIARAQSKPAPSPTDIVVAQDGSGHFKTVQDAIMSVPSGSAANPVVIQIKPGTYKELIYIQHEKRFFRLIGEDAKTTILTFDLNANIVGKNGKPIGTFRTPSAIIDADDFIAENITFENSSGPVGQALAIRVDGDRAVFRRCRFLGWQDTMFLNRGRQYFEECYISGHVDFIFGAATAFFDRCHIHCLRSGYITAASTYDYDSYGFVFSHCKITSEADVKTYLGRPWRDFSNVIFLNTEMSEVVRSEGWHNWNVPAREKTVRYAEFNSSGLGANSKSRVSWSRQLTKAQAKGITAKRVLAGIDGWDPLTPTAPLKRAR